MAQAGRASLKEQRYDRQLRLWGDHGQEALESAHVCVINATATGTEILKNLVLPGIGSFTIVDGHQVSGEDVGNNFFLQKSHIGQNRAQSATELLQELNNDVTGNFVEESAEELLDNDPSFFSRFNLVVATQLPESKRCRSRMTALSTEKPGGEEHASVSPDMLPPQKQDVAGRMIVKSCFSKEVAVPPLPYSGAGDTVSHRNKSQLVSLRC